MSVDFATGRFELQSQSRLSAAPMTLACWFNPDSVAAEFHLISLNDFDGVQLFTLGTGIGAGGTNDNVCAGTFSSGWAASVHATNITAGTWWHGASVIASATSRTAYLNGGAATPNTTSKTPTGVDNLDIGCQSFTSTNDNFYNGSIAEVGIWDAALTTAEIVSLARGVACPLVRPQNLVWYLPMIRATAQELMNADSFDILNATYDADHPRVIYPGTSRRFGFPIPAVGGGTNPKGPLGGLVFAGPFGGPIG